MKLVQNFRRTKSEWLSAISPGPLGPEFAKIAGDAVQTLRLGVRTNAPGRPYGENAPGALVRWERAGGHMGLPLQR